jgi:hypothetical protein
MNCHDSRRFQWAQGALLHFPAGEWWAGRVMARRGAPPSVVGQVATDKDAAYAAHRRHARSSHSTPRAKPCCRRCRLPGAVRSRIALKGDVPNSINPPPGATATCAAALVRSLPKPRATAADRTRSFRCVSSARRRQRHNRASLVVPRIELRSRRTWGPGGSCRLRTGATIFGYFVFYRRVQSGC